MSLVAYDNSSDESEEEQIEEPQKPPIANGSKPTQVNSESETSSQTIFTNLPQPKHTPQVEIEEAQDEFLQKKEVPEIPKPPPPKKIKIGIPALPQYDSDDDEPKVKKVKTVKGSGLFSILPPPKTTPISTKSFVPNSVAQKQKQSKMIPSSSRVNMNKSQVNTKPVNVKSQVNTKALGGTITQDTAIESGNPSKNDSDSEDDIETPSTFDEETWQKVCGRPKPKPKPIIEEPIQMEVPQYVEIAPEPEKPYDGLDNKAFKELVGKSRRVGNIKLIDINEEEILPDKDVWLTKALTDPEQAPKYVVKDPVNDTCKRKHHITYLAQQAKANEQELQNQWSANRFSRKQTQAKYGF